MENQKSKFQHVCEVDRPIYSIYSNNEMGFKCQFEGLYRHIREKHYDDFYDDFYEYKGKYYCPFHAPMEAKKIMGKQINMMKKDLLGIFYDIETITRKSYLNKFNNTIYGIINNQIKSFSARIEKDDYESKNEQRITLYGVVFPIGLSLTKHGGHCCAEHKNYIDCKDSFIPFLDSMTRVYSSGNNSIPETNSFPLASCQFPALAAAIISFIFSGNLLPSNGKLIESFKSAYS